MGQQLRSSKIVETLDRLEKRVGERFPDSGLSRLCGELLDTARQTAAQARTARRPIMWVRVLVVLLIVAFLVGQGVALSLIDFGAFTLSGSAAEVTQALEAAVNLVILLAAGLWFLLTLESRLKRSRVFGYLHELRSFAHVIDMHQLTKDPVSILHRGERTAHSPVREMTEFQLARYLDYCSEMLSLTGKLAALYGERTRDAQIVAAANDIETLTTNLGRKIWQKIMMIAGEPAPPAADGAQSGRPNTATGASNPLT